MNRDNKDCFHQSKKLVWTEINTWGDGLLNRQLREQCMDCGRLLSAAKTHSLATPHTPGVDQDALKKWQEDFFRKRQNNAYAERSGFLELATLADQNRAERSEEYQEYLQSEAWRKKRDRVMKRANFTCEGCGDARATEVHHLTYADIYNEFLWQLVAICRECHARFHDKNRQGNSAGQSHNDQIKRAG